jgi:hypothetical protein
MPFPTELDSTAIRQIVRFVTGADRDVGRVALAAYDLVGYALGKALNDPKFLADAVGDEPEVALIANQLVEANGEKLKAVLEKYGPLIVQLLLKALLKV